MLLQFFMFILVEIVLNVLFLPIKLLLDFVSGDAYRRKLKEFAEELGRAAIQAKSQQTGEFKGIAFVATYGNQTLKQVSKVSYGSEEIVVERVKVIQSAAYAATDIGLELGRKATIGSLKRLFSRKTS